MPISISECDLRINPEPFPVKSGTRSDKTSIKLSSRTSSRGPISFLFELSIHDIFSAIALLVSNPPKTSTEINSTATLIHHGTRFVYSLPLGPPLLSPTQIPREKPIDNHVVPSDNRPIVISGPSGVGKGTLYKLLLNRHPNTFATSVSHTTRDPRPGEQRDVDYYYIKMDEFEKMINEHKFVEHAKFGGNRYGTSKMTITDLTASGKVVLLDIEMEVSFIFES
jgi:hypothetical protein